MISDGQQYLLLLPGLVCDQTVWQPQIEALSGIAACSCPGWGLLDSLPKMADSVLQNAPDRFALAGHSMGGRVALEVYRRAPERVLRLALLDTGYQARPLGEAGEVEKHKRYALYDIALSKGMRAMGMEWLPPMLHPARAHDKALVEKILAMIERKTPDIFEAQIRALLARPDASELLGQIHCPTLVLCGREDSWSPPDQHQRIAAAIPGSKLVVIPECGHMSTLERPAEVSEALGTWLQA